MGAPIWLRYSVGGLSRLSSSHAASLAHAFFRRPSMTNGLSRENLARMAAAEAVMDAGAPMVSEIEGRRIAWRRFAGRGAGRVLLLHGWSGDSRAMAAFVEPLAAAGHEVITVDLPAHGGSCGDETSAVEAARLVASLLRARGLAPDHVIAHSYGGAVAGLMAEAGLIPATFTAIACPARFDLVLGEMAAVFGLSPTARARFAAMAETHLGRKLHTLDAARIWAETGASVLALHSPEDQRVAFAHSEALAQALNARLEPLEGLDHCAIVHSPRTVAAALAHIAGAAPALPKAA